LVSRETRMREIGSIFSANSFYLFRIGGLWIYSKVARGESVLVQKET
jgi:hypothetical protein